MGVWEPLDPAGIGIWCWTGSADIMCLSPFILNGLKQDGNRFSAVMIFRQRIKTLRVYLDDFGKLRNPIKTLRVCFYRHCGFKNKGSRPKVMMVKKYVPPGSLTL